MITVLDRAVPATEWADVSAAWPALTLTQTWAYGVARARTPWQVEHILLADGDHVIGTAQSMIRYLPLGLGGMCWISRGPLFDPNHVTDSQSYAELLSALYRHYALARGLYLRIAPAWPDDDPEFEVAARAIGFTRAGPMGWHSGTLDLTKSEEALRKNLAGKWRNPVNKAEKSGMTMLTGDSDDIFDAFCDAHDLFIAESGYGATVTGALLKLLRDVADPGLSLKVFQALLNGETMAWVMTACTGQRVEYLAGHATETGRRAGGGQYLLWQAITQAKREGATLFDVGGMDPVLTPDGIYKFKAGTGADPYALAPEMEALPRNPLRNLTARAIKLAAARARANG